MQITIEGEPGEGKSTLAIILSILLRRGLRYIVERIEEEVPRAEERRLDLEEDRISRGLLGPELARLQPRNIKVVVKNPPRLPEAS